MDLQDEIPLRFVGVALIETGPIKSSLDLEDKIPYSSWMALFEMSPIKSLHRVTGIFVEVAPQLDLQDERGS